MFDEKICKNCGSKVRFFKGDRVKIWDKEKFNKLSKIWQGNMPRIDEYLFDKKGTVVGFGLWDLGLEGKDFFENMEKMWKGVIQVLFDGEKLPTCVMEGHLERIGK